MNVDYINRKYLDKAERISEQGIGNSHFNHVARNALNVMFAVGPLYDSNRSRYLSHAKALRRYFELLEKYPDFRNGELNISMFEGGYFGKLDLNEISAELGLENTGSSVIFIEYASRMLKNTTF